MELNEGRIHIGNLDSQGGPVAIGGHIVDQRGRGVSGLRSWLVTVAWLGYEEVLPIMAADAGSAAQLAGVMAAPPADKPVSFTVVPA